MLGGARVWRSWGWVGNSPVSFRRSADKSCRVQSLDGQPGSVHIRPGRRVSRAPRTARRSDPATRTWFDTSPADERAWIAVLAAASGSAPELLHSAAVRLAISGG